MASKFETGHAKNVANLEKMIAFVRGYGATYQPSRTALQLEALEKLLEEARASLVEVTTHLTPFNIAVNARMELFKKLPPLSTRLLNALIASNPLDKTLENARSIVRKIKGIRLSKKEEAPLAAEVSAKTADTTLALYVPAPGAPETPAPNADVNAPTLVRQRSAANTSRDKLLEHFARLIALLEIDPHYQPNETELQVSTLKQYLEDLRGANSAVIVAAVALSNARMRRDDTLYGDNTGVCDVAKDVKAYVKAAFGVDSPQYKQIKGLRFIKKR